MSYKESARMDVRCYPGTSQNPNVPSDVLLVAESNDGAGTVTTYYITRSGTFWRVGNLPGDERNRSSLSQMCRMTFDTEQAVIARYRQFAAQP